ncbi:MAG: hypothetical protein BMS9Abin18_1307 [Zetaproteobacteria bacterium]|nr:MAG: hypothetical protein BMS9Abin18_1307 [Zetaproteobacteria bacterium]
MDTYRDIESLFSDYFADDVGPAMRYASLRKQAAEEQTAPAWNQAMVREENDGNKD